MSTRAAIYCRISKDREGAGLGVERQEADCRALANRVGWDVVATFVDNDISAYSGKPRKHYLRMLEAIKRGEIDAVFCWHTDRLHRSPVELENYIAVCEPRSVPTLGVKAGALDLTTSMGRMQARIAGAVARQEAEHMSERIRAEKEKALVTTGYIGGARPFGYGQPIRNEQGAIVGQEVTEAEAALIKDAVVRVISGESLYAITKQWKATTPAPRGGHGWTPMNVRRILINPRNAGIVVHRGTIVEGVRGCWPAIITEDEHRAVTAILTAPDRASYVGSRSLRWLGTNLYRCGVCGAAMRSAGVSSRGADGSRHAAYRCTTAAHCQMRADHVDGFVRRVIRERLRTHGGTLIDAPTQDTAPLHEETNALRARLVELEDMLGDGEIDRAGFGRQRGRIMIKLDALTEQLAAHDAGSKLSGVADAADPGAAFDSQTIERQRSIVDALMVVTIKPGRPGRLPKGVDFDDARLEIDWH